MQVAHELINMTSCLVISTLHFIILPFFSRYFYFYLKMMISYPIIMTNHVSTYIHNGNYLGIWGYLRVSLDCFVFCDISDFFYLVFFEYF